ncbi:MAG TPA: hypothetical protein VFI61_03980 [Patescibacteria group bacterium]|nr:hypothetical protein [Patescibacteria group bacterium]
MNQFGSSRSFSVTAFGREIIKVNLENQLGGFGAERGGNGGGPASKSKDKKELIEVKSDLIAPLIAEVVANLRQLAPDLIGNLDDTVIQTERDINCDEACRIFRYENKLKKDDVVDLVFKFGAISNLYQVENVALAGGIKSNIRSVVDAYWDQPNFAPINS